MKVHRFPAHRRRLRSDTRAATVVEYGLIVSLIVIVAMMAIAALADVTTGMWNNVSDEVTRARP